MDKLKQLLADPKKARLFVICALAALATLAAIIVYILYAAGLGAAGPDGPSQPSQSPSAEPSASARPAGLTPSKSLEEARQIALADAGVAASQAEFSRAELGDDHGIWVYQFAFQARNTKYDYEINANTGDVYSKIVEHYAAATPTPQATEPPAATATPSPDPDSQPPAETESQSAPSQDPESAPSTTPPAASASPAPSPSPAPDQFTPMYIGMSQAKSIALDHAGFTSSQVRFTHIGMDHEDGAMVYEIEFRQGSVEYEYEIDAATGRILSWERDED